MSPRHIKKFFLLAAMTIAGLTILIFLFLVGASKYYASGRGLPKLDQNSVAGESKELHKILLLDSGVGSLHQRLELIRRAKRSVELEFFIYNVDEASRLITQELIKKSREGVRVRVMVDFAAPVFQLRPVYARFLKAFGIEVRYYNTAPIYRLFSAQHRSHRKLLIIDRETFLTGGRNIGDDYFDLSPHYNFLDSDVQITGPIVEPVVASFDLYWSSPLARAADRIDEALTREELDEAKRFFLPRAEDAALLTKISTAGRGLVGALPTYECRDILFVTDFPDKGEGNRRVFTAIAQLMEAAKQEVWAESPYFVIKQGGYEVLERVREKGVSLKVLTNSLYATDAYYTIAALYPDLGWVAESGIDLYAYDGTVPKRELELPYPPAERWGIHAKRAVIDRKVVLIGTYNIDPRSANLNSELMVACRDNPAFAKAVLASIEARARNAKIVVGAGKVENTEALFGETEFGQHLRFWISLPFANLFDFLL